MKKAVDAATTRAAVEVIAEWIQRPEDTEKPGRAALALATRSTARTLEADAPGHSVSCGSPHLWQYSALRGRAIPEVPHRMWWRWTP